MPNDANQTPIQISWVKFATSVQGLLAVQIDDRPLDQYLVFRDTVLGLVLSEQFLSELQKAWAPRSDHPKRSNDSKCSTFGTSSIFACSRGYQNNPKARRSKGWVEEIAESFWDSKRQCERSSG